jgi:DNA-binding SARP family transcriptional activator
MLRANGVRASVTAPAGLLRAVARSAPVPIAIQTLGGFVVVRDGSALSEADWQSRKARELLKILVSRRGRATPRELLMDTLWPDDPPDAVSNRLSVALSTLRSVLDPEKRHATDAFVQASRESIGLGRQTIVDVEMFLREAEEGLALRGQGRSIAATDRLAYAESLYAGEFLDDDPYSEWAVPLREEARAAYIAIMRALAEDAAQRGEYETASRNYRRILVSDGYDESAHLGLSSCLASTGRHGEARRAYRAYVEAMDRIGVTPSSFPAPRS